MTALLLAVFVASVVGSLHCAGMCGPLLACAVANPEENRATTHHAELGPGFGAPARLALWRGRVVQQSAYHGGRLVSYLALGAAAGALGALLDLGGVLANVRPLAAALAGAAMIVIGLLTLTHAMNRLSGKLKLPRRWITAVSAVQRTALRLPPTARAGLIGLGTTLLPCGWLYAFAITAAGTGSAAWGTAVMAVFWLGTLPLMTALGLGLQGVLGFSTRRLPLLTGTMMIVIGAFTLINRADLDPAWVMSATHAQTPAHHASVPSPDAAPACCALGTAVESATAPAHDHNHDH